MSWLLDIVVNVTEEDEANSCTNSCAVKEVVALVRAYLISNRRRSRQMAQLFPNYIVLSGPVEEEKKKCNKKDSDLVKTASLFRVSLFLVLKLRLEDNQVFV